MSSTRTYLNILVQLARVDGIVVQEEIDLINQIGKAHGLSEAEIMESFDDPSDIDDLSHLPDDEKYEYIYGIVQLMKIDGRLYEEEIKFCAKMVSKLGYKEDVLFELILKIYSDPNVSADKAALKDRIQSFLN
ncbi:MAG: TerB family tellurite resistance protein [Cyclobacteriaceae bacterium]